MSSNRILEMGQLLPRDARLQACVSPGPVWRYIHGTMESALKEQLKPGTRVKITQQIPGRDYTWTTEVAGTITQYQQKPTGSWYAHSRNDKLWLDRLTLRKDDGEITTLNLDEYSAIEPVGGAQVEEV